MAAIDVGFIDRQSRRITALISHLEQRLTIDEIKAGRTSDDLVDLLVTRPDGTAAHCLHMPSLIDTKRLHSEVLLPLTSSSRGIAQAIPQATRITTRAQADQALVQGSAVLFVGSQVFDVPIRVVPNRSVQEPTTERAVFGPKDSLVETLDDSMALVRSHLRDPHLMIERMAIGTQAVTSVAVLYIDGAVETPMLDDVLDRLSHFHPPRVGFVTSLLHPLFGTYWSSFLPVDVTEKPYRVADYLARGMIVVMADGSPFAMAMPVPFLYSFVGEEEHLQSVTTRYFVRGLRVLAFLIALLGPGLYIAILTVNTSILPGLLAIAVASNRQTIAFPIITETLLLLLILDIMAEATTAMKGVLGPAISIVGSLIVGQAAVRANLASNLGVILLAATALATYISPRYLLTFATRVWRYPIVMLSAMFGLVGWSVGVLWLGIHLSKKRVLGVPYTTPLGPLLPKALKTTSRIASEMPDEVPNYLRRRGSSP